MKCGVYVPHINEKLLCPGEKEPFPALLPVLKMSLKYILSNLCSWLPTSHLRLHLNPTESVFLKPVASLASPSFKQRGKTCMCHRKAQFGTSCCHSLSRLYKKHHQEKPQHAKLSSSAWYEVKNSQHCSVTHSEMPLLPAVLHLFTVSLNFLRLSLQGSILPCIPPLFRTSEYFCIEKKSNLLFLCLVLDSL